MTPILIALVSVLPLAVAGLSLLFVSRNPPHNPHHHATNLWDLKWSFPLEPKENTSPYHGRDESCRARVAHVPDSVVVRQPDLVLSNPLNKFQLIALKFE
jgi:hypothetical protein